MSAPSRTAAIRAAAIHDPARAEARLAALLGDLFGITPRNLRINLDRYSLNSLNGFFDGPDGPCFFKFHQEEGEEAMRGEYYRADILARAGLPVDQPLRMSALPGEQILIYRRRDEPRFSDVLRALDLAPDRAAEGRALAAEWALNDRLLAVAQASLTPITPEQSAAEPIHRLFHQRLIDPATGGWPGGRWASFYVGQRFDFPGLSLDWAELSRLRWRLNGVLYARPLGALFEAAAQRLDPLRLADAGGIVAHGDAHNANVWFGPQGLSLFDPAFAGAHVPSLLAEIKPTFHNTLAHPLWLYDAGDVPARWQVSARLRGEVLEVETDWQPGRLREDLLAAKAERFWRPWLAHLHARDLLPGDWQEVMRLALFLCPTLVMDLRAGGAHNPASSALGLALAVSLGSAPEAGADRITRFFDAIRPGA